MKPIIFLSSFVCFFVLTFTQETTILSTVAPETTTATNATDINSTQSTTIVDSSTISIPPTATTTTTPSTTTATTSSTSTSTSSTTTSATTATTTTATTTTTTGNSTNCTDASPLCKSFLSLCDIPKSCEDRKKKGSKEKSKEKKDKSKKSKERKSKHKHSEEDIELSDVEGDEDDEDEGDVCAWVRQQQNPALQEIAKKCDEENTVSPAQSNRKPVYRRSPKSSKEKNKAKHLDCRFRETASTSFKLLCPESCEVC